MERGKLIYTLFILVLASSTFAQENNGQTNELSESDVDISTEKHNFDIGIGLGCDYAGLLGLKLSYVPIPYFSIFASGGFAMFDFAYNLGACYHILPKTAKHAVRPHIIAMYGYNEIIVLFDAKEYNKLYYGFTPGFGLEYRLKKSRNRGFDFDLNFPFRSDEFREDFERIDENPDVNIKAPLPFAFAIGYHYEF